MRIGRKYLWSTAIIAVVLFAAGTLLAFRVFRRTPNVPTTEVKRGDFVDYLQLRGEIKAVKSGIIAAPSDSGDLLILKLVPNGARVRKGEIVVQFDSTPLERQRDQKRSELRTADADIERTVAQKNQDNEHRRTDLLAARYSVERAKLDASKQEILSEIDGEKTKLALDNTERKLVEVGLRIKAGEIFTEADLSSKKRKRDKVRSDLRKIESQIASLTVRAPLDGMVTIMPSSRGRTAQEFKAGDQAWPSAVVAEMPELKNFRLITRVDETERRRLTLDQSAFVRVDALSDKQIPASVVGISTLAKPDYSSIPPPKNFDVEIQLNGHDRRLRPGMSGNARIMIERIPDSILIPTEALFQKAGRPIVYVLRDSRFHERTVQIGRRGGTDVLVTGGLAIGELVALKDPTQETQDKQ